MRPIPHFACALIAALALTSVIAFAQAPAKGRPQRSSARSRPTGPQYASYVRSWHSPAADKTPPVDPAGRPMLALYSLNTGDRIELAAAGERGGFAASDLDRAAFVLRESFSGNEHPVDPRLVDLVYRIQLHFAAQEVRVISGYRTPRGGGSNHGKGRAMDIVVPGASDADVAKFARELGFVGVGIYPSSGFVHVDVRDRSYFWSDSSGPGRRNRERGILGDLAAESDRQAVARGESPPLPFIVRPDVDAALRARAPATPALPPATTDDEDDDENAHGG